MGVFDELHAIPPQMFADGYLARAVHGERLALAVVEVEPVQPDARKEMQYASRRPPRIASCA